jgi:hypothetical protein
VASLRSLDIAEIGNGTRESESESELCRDFVMRRVGNSISAGANRANPPYKGGLQFLTSPSSDVQLRVSKGLCSHQRSHLNT